MYLDLFYIIYKYITYSKTVMINTAVNLLINKGKQAFSTIDIYCMELISHRGLIVGFVLRVAW